MKTFFSYFLHRATILLVYGWCNICCTVFRTGSSKSHVLFVSKLKNTAIEFAWDVNDADIHGYIFEIVQNPDTRNPATRKIHVPCHQTSVTVDSLNHATTLYDFNLVCSPTLQVVKCKWINSKPLYIDLNGHFCKIFRSAAILLTQIRIWIPLSLCMDLWLVSKKNGSKSVFRNQDTAQCTVCTSLVQMTPARGTPQFIANSSLYDHPMILTILMTFYLMRSFVILNQKSVCRWVYGELYKFCNAPPRIFYCLPENVVLQHFIF